MLLPIVQRENRPLIISALAALIILLVGVYWMGVGRHTAGDEGGSFMVVPLKQMLIAALIALAGRVSVAQRVRNAYPIAFPKRPFVTDPNGS